MRPTPAQQEAFESCLTVARVMQAGLQPTSAQLERIRHAVRALKAEPQPDGFVADLEAGLRVFLPELLDEGDA